MFVPAPRSRPNCAHFRIHDLDRRSEAFAYGIAMIGHKSRLGAGNQKYPVDPVRQESGNPFRCGRVIEPRDGYRVIGPALKSGIEALTAGSYQLCQPILGET